MMSMGRHSDQSGPAGAEPPPRYPLRGRLDPHPAAERLQPVPEAEKARAGLESGAATAVVADPDPKDAVGDVHVDVDDRGAGVPGGVSERLGHDVVGGNFDRLGQSPHTPDIEAD